MAKKIINIGTTANDKSGDLLRTAFGKVNDNFTELYARAVNTDAQTLTLNGSALSISGGNSVTLPASGTTLPSLSGNEGKFLRTDGTELSWVSIIGDGAGLSVTDFGEGFSLTDADKIVTNKLYSTNATNSNVHYRLELDTNGVVRLPDGSIINGSTIRGVAGTGELNYTGITIGPNSEDAEKTWMWVDHANAYVSTNNAAHTWTFGNDGSLTFPGAEGFQATFGSVFPVGDVLHSVNNLHLESEQSVTVNSGDQVADLENNYIDLELTWALVRDQDAEIIAPATRPWAGMPSYEAYDVLMNYNQNPPGGILPPASNMAPTAKTASDAYDFWQEELTASGVNISVAGSKVWNFSGDGSTTFPGTLQGVVEIDSETQTQTGHTLSIAPAGDYTSKSFNFRVDQYQGPGSFTRAFLDMPIAEVNKPVAISFRLANSGSGSIFNQGNNTNGLGMNDAFNIFRNGGDVKITAQASSGGFNLYTWKFANDGSLTFPDASVIASYKPVTVIATTTTAQTIPDNSSASIIQFVETVDTANAFSPGLFTAPYTGYYQINMSLYFSTSGAPGVNIGTGSFLLIDTNLDNTKQVIIFNGAWSGSYLHYSTVIPATAGDAIRVAVRQVSGFDIDIASGSRLTIHRVSIS
jgi:hypothetical protein